MSKKSNWKINFSIEKIIVNGNENPIEKTQVIKCD
jgi:hypothetical protein|tara:strand:+ start:107 stop:211 length:105 start_codon:yes stop_codon:yes gene_type:complete